MSLQLVLVCLLVVAAAVFIARSVRRTLGGNDSSDGCHGCARPQPPRGLGHHQPRTGTNEQKPVARP
jgi:hypothetical protein